ncbi:hypothetical protein GDO78_012707 [Eleutherodactylus coqui]|uniref:Phosphatidylinositol-glycan-specific phospholipase D n=1 Tax=Eleutherodactylus coqui TaxID=57060 RepID=A0A8J6F2H0_ELECQ|nr:hypothetical protein GDO78_012707 [Eleutherodactylus coqui]
MHTMFHQLLQKHSDAFQAGSVYPDTFYQGLCRQGQYRDVSEDSHWTPFLETSVNYIRKTYPLPWNEDAQKLVAFLFGIASHMVADVSWHSLGIDQGFLRAMGAIDFHGSYSKAHEAGDFGGDVLSQYELNFDYLERKCIKTSWLLIVLISMVLQLYSTFARKSPFLVERFHEYFLGGMDDMAAWSTNIFHIVSFLLDNGTSPGRLRPQSNEFYRDFNSSSSIKSVGTDIISSESGVYFQLNQWAEYANHIHTPAATYFVNSSYSRLGWSVTTADLNNDGWEDLVVGAPGCSTLGHFQVGCVYIVYGNDSGIPSDNIDLDESADVLLRGFESAGRFGSSVTVLDFNVDGQLDLAVGAPSVGSSQLTYKGAVYVYYGSTERGFSSQPNVTIKCRFSYCNFGWILHSADVNEDKMLDLVVGSPYAPGGGKQRGLVVVFYASHRRSTTGSLYVEEADWSISGEQNYAWFGYSIHSHDHKNKTLLVIGSPTWSSCKRYFFNVSSQQAMYYCENPQSVGKAFGFYPPSKSIAFILHGTEDQSKMGSSFASGTLAVNGENKRVLIIGSPTQRTRSKVVFISSELKHAGTATVYDLKGKTDPSPLGTLRGDREFSRFGIQLHLSDLDDDGLDEIIVSAPLRNDDITSAMFGSQTGRVYIYNGNITSPGMLSGKCKSWFSPCPEDWEKARFGSAVTTIKSKHKKQVVVAAVRSSRKARLAGSLYIYNLF